MEMSDPVSPSTSKGRKSSKRNSATASFNEDNDHVEMEVEGISDDFMSEEIEDSLDDESVKIVVSKKQLDEWRKINKRNNMEEFLGDLRMVTSDGQKSRSSRPVEQSRSPSRLRDRSSSRESGEIRV